MVSPSRKTIISSHFACKHVRGLYNCIKFILYEIKAD